jgi:hypothetical protein
MKTAYFTLPILLFLTFPVFAQQVCVACYEGGACATADDIDFVSDTPEGAIALLDPVSGIPGHPEPRGVLGATISSPTTPLSVIYSANIDIFLCAGWNSPAECPSNRYKKVSSLNGVVSCVTPIQTILSLNSAEGSTPPRPAGAEGNGKSVYVMVATVTDGGIVKPNKTVTFELTVEAGSGGHPIATNRPKGELTVFNGKTDSSGVTRATTDAKGEIKVAFTASAFSGTHSVLAKCTDCMPNGLKTTHTFDVKVPGLSPFRADTQTPARWAFVGLDRYHGEQRFYLTTQAQINLVALIDAIQAVRWALPGSKVENQSWGQVGINDASLIWGGRYPGDNGKTPLATYPWTGTNFHAGHRLGVEVDLRTSSQSKPNRKRIYEAICAIEEEILPPTLLYHYDKGPHFHAYLLGNIDKKLGGSDCWESAK